MDLILRNGNIITMDATHSRASSVAVKWGKAFRIGTDEEIFGLADPTTKVVDLKGKTVLPGFIDTHNHLSFYGYLVSSADCQSASGLESIDDLSRSSVRRLIRHLPTNGSRAGDTHTIT